MGTRGERNGAYRHGRFTQEALMERKWLRDTRLRMKSLMVLAAMLTPCPCEPSYRSY